MVFVSEPSDAQSRRPTLVIEGLNKVFGDIHILKDISLHRRSQ